MDSPNINYFAETDSRNKRLKFGIKDEDRLRHIYSIGKTGMGKSTMLENMAIQDIQNGNGMAFLDPHGKTADLLLEYVPEHRMKDVIYFAPFDTEHPVSFNVMEDVGPQRRHLVVSGLMSAFEKIWADAWSARMAYILQNTLAALLEYPGATLLGVNRMYSDKEYRNKVVESITDPTIRSFWVDEFSKYTDRYTQEATPAIQNKVGQFTSNPLIRNIIGQPKSSFDIRKIMDEKKIFIVNLSKGLVGEGNANLLGSMLVTKIYLAAMSRADASPQELKNLPNFYLYVDEFQSFANKSFADILSEARKYKLSLNITHQYVEQMAEEVRAAVFGNVGTMVAFRVGSYDAELLEKEFAPVFTMEDIVNLGQYQIYLKLMIDGVASQPFSATTLPPISKQEVSFREEVLQMSRKNFAKPREEVEKTINEWHASEVAVAKQSHSQQTPSEYKKDRKPEALHAHHKNQDRTKVEPPKIFEGPRENHLSKAIGNAIKNVNTKHEEKPREENKPIPNLQKVSLSQLKPGADKNKNPSPQNMSALRQAIDKIKVNPVSPPPAAKKEEHKQSAESSDKKNSEVQSKRKEVPEETLRKILKGQ